MNGDYCCKTNKEKKYGATQQDIISGTCDGINFDFDSTCCEYNEFLKCPYSTGCSTIFMIDTVRERKWHQMEMKFQYHDFFSAWRSKTNYRLYKKLIKQLLKSLDYTESTHSGLYNLS